jgi:hypothetical protein
MATYVQLYDMTYTPSYGVTTPPLTKKVTVAVATAAVAILSESEGTTNHADRLVWAQSTLLAVPGAAQKMMWAALADADVLAHGDAATDAEVQDAVNAVVDAFAG